MISRKSRLLKASDRLIGPTLLRLMRPPSKSDRNAAPVPAESISQILIMRPGGLGDAILTLPMIRSLRDAFPDSTIDVLAERRNAGVYAIDDFVDDVIVYDAQPLKMFQRLRNKNYDLVIDTEQYHHLSRMISSALRTKYVCGFTTVDGGRLLTHPVEYSDDTYEAISFLALLESLTGSPAPFDAEAAFVTVREDAGNWVRNRLGDWADREFVTVMPAAGGPYRLWSADRYSEVVRWLTDRGTGVIVIGGEDALPLAEEITQANDSGLVLDLTGSTTLAQTAAVLARARLSLSADTGIMHLAYGVGTPSVALFGPGRQMKWAPPGRLHRTVRLGLDCSPCTKMGRTPSCPHAIACMKEIGVQPVVKAIEALL